MIEKLDQFYLTLKLPSKNEKLESSRIWETKRKKDEHNDIII